MKCLKLIQVLVLVTASYLHTSAQGTPNINSEPDYNKPKLFSDLPEKMKFQFSDVESLLHLQVGSSVNTSLASNFKISGTVVSVSEPYDKNVKSVVIKLNNRGGAIFTFTRVTSEDGTYEFSGRLLNRNNSDAIDIVKENGNYLLVKKNLYDLFSE
ncbi:MAG TPA: hypothetical protein VM368_09815 [Flavisolibacter sp.]|nr:hypothetical protein [Flavisolibacter sp.]